MFDAEKSENKTRLMTIGYEGSVIEDFIATLKYAGVNVLIDVRELPLSRKKGFSKNKLRDALDEAGITYHHVKQLGDPKDGRNAAKSGDYKTFKKIFGSHIKLEASQQALHDLAPVVEAGGACLLCFERCHSKCHRSIVADELAKIVEFDLLHIGVKRGLAKQFIAE